MKPRWNANTWVLVIFAAVMVLTAVDLGRRLVAGPGAAPPPPPDNSLKPSFKVGDPAPDFTLPDKDKKPQSLSSLVKRDTLLFFLCGCTNCKAVQTYAAVLSKKMGDRAPDFIGVTSTKPDFEAKFLEQTGLKEKLLYEQADNKVMNLYKGHPCPRVYRLDKDRKITWIGPSMAQLSHHNAAVEVGEAMAKELGFVPENLAGPGKHVAPEMEPPEGGMRPPLHHNGPAAKPPEIPAGLPEHIPPPPGNQPNRFRDPA